MHAAPADLAFRRKPLAMIGGDVAGLAKGLRHLGGVAGRVLGPFSDTRRGIDAHDSTLAHAQIAEPPHDPAGLLDRRKKCGAPLTFIHGRSAADRRPDRRNGRTDRQTAAAHVVGQRLDPVVVHVDRRVRIRQEQVDTIEFHAVNRRGLGHIQHLVETDRRLFLTLSDQPRPHCVMQLGVRVSSHLILPGACARSRPSSRLVAVKAILF